MTNEDPANKEQFLEQLTQAWTELQATLDRLSEEQMTQRQDRVGWTVKDHLGHLVSWEEGITALLRREPRWEAMGVDMELAKSRLVEETEDAAEPGHARPDAGVIAGGSSGSPALGK